MKKRILIVTAIILAAMTAVIIIGWSSVTSEAGDVEDRVLHYESIEIRPNDTLWDIASVYAEDCGMNIRTYIREIKKVNAMESDRIISGGHLIIMHY